MGLLQWDAHVCMGTDGGGAHVCAGTGLGSGMPEEEKDKDISGI